MADSLYVILLLWTLRCAGALGVKEESSMRVAFANEIINASCNVTFAYTKEHSKFKFSYFWINLEGKEITVNKSIVSENIPKDRVNATVTKPYSLLIKPANHNSVSGTYYCKAVWKTTTKRGYGTFILFRDKGYEEPLHITWMLLITFTIALAVLSVMGTVLLFWKREVAWPRRRCGHAKKCPVQGPAPQHPSHSPELSEPTYMDLKPHQSDVYEDIKNDASSASGTIQKMMPTTEVSGQKTQGKIQDFYENNITDVYENI